MPQPDIPFSDASALRDYAEKTARIVPGLHDLQTMAALLVAERAPDTANVLVIGAGGGGGMELKALAEAHPQWQFVGVDPSQPMLDLAAAALGPLAERAQLHLGYTDTAPTGPFDAATCLLTMHFVAIEERRSTLKEIHRRLKPGAPFVMAHLSFPQASEERELWLSRYAAFAIASGVEPENAHKAAATIGSTLPLLGPEQEEELLQEAGFTNVRLFYVGMAFRGWVAQA
ncbi:class I SAM-dependent methyltransferase [Variovorax sp. ZS18.2.2]|uniref:class I SAM-dependent methyltransferase n=1 Tax=Variovorax sp. ZS18.2.2 TaxID=2971255 RepID=UPI002150F967|nr:class I SAM-dependent methyltransferase [Variovorax sp. ZS18.2.2]MCR6475187.1 class I SAM-dependent methyltransferase [Variovorax sp. ZS18.2.2]